MEFTIVNVLYERYRAYLYYEENHSKIGCELENMDHMNLNSEKNI